MNKTKQLLHNLLVGLTVSLMALSLGASLGVLSGRGAFQGMLSAGLIACICSLIGPRIQCSGPTAPMSAAVAGVVAYVLLQQPSYFEGLSADQFLNLSFFVTGIFLLIFAVFKLGRFISLIPNVVVSGFMNGIALLIWLGQLSEIFQFERFSISSFFMPNVFLAAMTLFLLLFLPYILGQIAGEKSSRIPVTLLVIVLMSVWSQMLKLEVPHVQLGQKLAMSGDFFQNIIQQFPHSVSYSLLLKVLPFSMNLAILCYFDTLLTSRVIDKITQKKLSYDQELSAQGVANIAVGMIGGVPGAQTTLRSVALLKEKASMRLAGFFAGFFVLVEIFLFQDLIAYIPQAVFSGVLLKIGLDIVDTRPLILYLKQWRRLGFKMLKPFSDRHDEEKVFISNREVVMILSTMLASIFWGLSIAIFLLTLIFYLANHTVFSCNPIRDLEPGTETDEFIES